MSTTLRLKDVYHAPTNAELFQKRLRQMSPPEVRVNGSDPASRRREASQMPGEIGWTLLEASSRLEWQRGRRIEKMEELNYRCQMPSKLS